MDNVRFASLTVRQKEALRLLATPMRPKEIATQMGLSPRTVEDHLAEATRRVGATRPLEAARLFAEFERIPPEYLRPEETRIGEPAIAEPSDVTPAQIETASQGRLIRLDPWQRTAIIVGLTIGLIFALFIQIAGGETVARFLRSEFSRGSSNSRSGRGVERRGEFMSKLNDRLSVGQTIAPPLRALEGDIESGFANAGRLMAAIGDGRLKARVPFEVGLDAIAHINTCLGSMVIGARSINALHASLDVLRADLGVPATAVGDYGDKPAMTPVEQAQLLRIAS